jgi:hypothetical protein
MKKIITTVLTALLLTTTATAFFDNDIEFPLADNNPYMNGMFAFNSYTMMEPQWYAKEMENLFNEFDTGTNHNNSYYTSYASAHNFPYAESK